jgi:uncharacterized glyoxalase superfamily protein PhnB
MDQRLSLITLGTDDLSRAREFYESGMGWKLLHAAGDVAFYQLPGFALALYPRKLLAEDACQKPGRGFSGITLAYNAQSTSEVNEVLEQAEKAGGVIVKPAQETFWGGYSGYFTDKDGHVWEVAHGTFYTVDKQGNTLFAF